MATLSPLLYYYYKGVGSCSEAAGIFSIIYIFICMDYEKIGGYKLNTPCCSVPPPCIVHDHDGLPLSYGGVVCPSVLIGYC